MDWDNKSDCEIVCALGEGRSVRLYAPVGPALCDRCGQRSDDVAYMIDGQSESKKSGGLCGPCLAAILPAESAGASSGRLHDLDMDGEA